MVSSVPATLVVWRVIRYSLRNEFKDLYKTSNGKYIAPQAIEMVMSGDNYIEQIAVIGDQRKFVSALIVPAYPLLEKYAGKKASRSRAGRSW